MRQIPLGARGTSTLRVQPEHLANRFKDAILPQVLATPIMILIMENAALNAIRPFFDAGESAVGTAVNVKHLVATPVGHEVRATAEDCREADGGIIAQRRDGFQRHVTGTLDGPFVVLLEQDRSDEANDGVLIGEDADHLGPPLDLAVEALDRVGRVQLGPMLEREAHVGKYIGLGLVQKGCELWQLGAELVGDLPPLRPGGLGIVLRKRSGDEGGDDTSAALAGMSQRIAHEVHAAPLPGGVEDLADGGLDALMGVGDNQLDAAQFRGGQLAQERRPERLGLEGPMSMPRTSRRPSLLTPTPTITATETIRPFWRTFT
jgi:predicted thioesterase